MALKRSLAVSLLCFMAATYARADSCTVTGVILGKETKQALPGAEVILINEATNIPRRTISDATGHYSFNLVFPPGLYTIRVTLKDFVTTELRHLSVAINQSTVPVPPITLDRATGGSSPMSFEGRSAAVNFTDAATKMVFDPEGIQALPLSGVRTFDQLALLAPGVTEVPASSGSGPGVGPGVGTAGQFSVNGQRGRNNNFLVDLSDNNDQDVGVRRQGYVSLVAQSIESVQNFQILTGNFQSEFGRNGGSIVNAVSKSGGNSVHGNAYGYYVNDGLSARNFFDRSVGSIPDKSPFSRAQYGFALGGPIVRDRTFWFGSFENQKVKDRPETHFAVPTLKQRSFFGYSPLSYTGKIDDLTKYFLSQNVALFGIAGRGVWNLVPVPNYTAGPYGENTYTEQLNGDGRGSIFSMKLDHKLNGPNTLTGRYNFTDDEKNLPSTGNAIHSSVHSKTRTQNISLFLNSNWTDRTSNQARFSYGRTRLDFQETPGSPFLFGSKDQADLLNVITPGSVLEQMLKTPIKTDFGSGSYGPFGSTGALGQLRIHPFSPVGVDVYNFPQKRVNNTFQYADTFIHQRGSHTLKAGVDIRRVQQNSRLDRNLRPLADFGGALGTSINLMKGAVRGTDLASIGYATGFLQAIVPDFNDDGKPDFDTSIGLRFTEYGFFVQDDWKVTPRLSVNLGLRYEFDTAPTEVNQKIESTFADVEAGIPPSSAPPLLKIYEPVYNSVVAGLNSFIGGRDQIFEPGKNNWAPRLGMAWDPRGNGRTALRAGFGIFYDQNLSAVTSQSRNVFPHLIPLNSSGFNSPISGLLLINPQYLTLNDLKQEYPIIRVGTLNTTGTPSGYFRSMIGLLAKNYQQGVAFTLPTQKLASPYAEHYHVTFEQEIKSGVMVSIGYFGSRGIHLTRFRAPNLGISGNPDFVATPYSPGLAQLVATTVSPARMDGRLGAYTVFENTGDSSYNSLQFSSQGRLSKQFQYTMSYAWSHVLDEVSDVFDGTGFYSMPQSQYNLAAEKASANFDARHRFTASYVWNLPWGGSHPLLGGWSLAGMFFSRSGQPYTVNTSFDVNKDGVFTDRLNTTQGIQVVDSGRVSYQLPSGAISDGVAWGYVAASGKDGAVGRNTFQARGIATLDFSVLKKFRMSEQSGLEFRAETFNLFNRTHFGVPVRILEAPGFGSSVDTLVNARRVQLALKLNF